MWKWRRRQSDYWLKLAWIPHYDIFSRTILLSLSFTCTKYAIQTITSASLVAAKRKATEVGIEDITKVYLFDCNLLFRFTFTKIWFICWCEAVRNVFERVPIRIHVWRNWSYCHDGLKKKQTTCSFNFYIKNTTKHMFRSMTRRLNGWHPERGTELKTALLWAKKWVIGGIFRACTGL